MQYEWNDILLSSHQHISSTPCFTKTALLCPSDVTWRLINEVRK